MSKSLNDIHLEAVRRFHDTQTATRDERIQSLKDRRFCHLRGAQWEGPLSEQFKNKPKIEINKVRKSVNDICDDFQNNRLGSRFLLKDGVEDEELSDACASLHRSDEQDSVAEEAYDNAFSEGVSGGIGGWRLRAEYEDEGSPEDERQRIRIEPIFDADSALYYDLNAKRQDKSDARFAFLVTSMSRAEYELVYDDNPSDWPKEIHEYENDWLTPDVVYVAEYYNLEEEHDTVHFFKGLSGEEVSHSGFDLEETTGLKRMLRLTGFKEVRKKKVIRRRIHKYIMNGNEVLSDEGRIAGTEIPLVPYYANRTFIDNLERCSGHTRFAIDPQMVKNMLVSKLAEFAGLSSMSKPILTPEQISGHENAWAEDNIENFAYLLVNAVMDPSGTQALSGPVGWTKSAEVPEVFAALLKIVEEDAQGILGSPNDQEKTLSHVSGEAITKKQTQIDRKSLRYIINMAKAMRRSGQIWVSMASEIYTEKGRKMKGVDANGKVRQLELQKPMIGADGRQTTANDLTRAKFDVFVDVGPSNASKRQAIVQSITDMLPFVDDPQTKTVLIYTAMMNSEAEGMADLHKWFRKQLVKMSVIEPTPAEAQQMAAEAKNAQPSPSDQYLLAETEKSKADTQKSVADISLLSARTEKTKVDSLVALAKIGADKEKAALDQMKTLSDIHLDHKSSAVETAQSLHGMLPEQPTSEQGPSGKPGGSGSA